MKKYVNSFSDAQKTQFGLAKTVGVLVLALAALLVIIGCATQESAQSAEPEEPQDPVVDVAEPTSEEIIGTTSVSVAPFDFEYNLSSTDCLLRGTIEGIESVFETNDTGVVIEENSYIT
jgi:hypothetical protein